MSTIAKSAKTPPPRSLATRRTRRLRQGGKNRPNNNIGSIVMMNFSFFFGSLFIIMIMTLPVMVSARPPMMLFNELLKRFHKTHPDYQPNAIVDIGANKGEWTKTAWKLFPSTKFLMIEASPMHNETLFNVTRELQSKSLLRQQQQQFGYEIAVLSDIDNTPVSFFQSGDTGNSMFREKSVLYQDEIAVTRIARTLDSLIANSFLKDERIDIIKADVQGAELVVFKGATKTLQQASLVQFEGSTIRYNSGGSCTHDVDAFLRGQQQPYGYYLYDIGGQVYDKRLFRTDGLGQYDVLYIRPDSKYLPTSLSNNNAEFCGNDGGDRGKDKDGGIVASAMTTMMMGGDGGGGGGGGDCTSSSTMMSSSPSFIFVWGIVCGIFFAVVVIPKLLSPIWLRILQSLQLSSSSKSLQARQ